MVPEDQIHCPVHGWVESNSNHIVPRSRGGKNAGNLQKEICPLCHEYYHWLFSNLLPSEIIAYLVKRFWGGQIRWIFISLWQHFLRKMKKDNDWPESEANWTIHPAEGRHRLELEGARRRYKRARELGLGRGDLCVINVRTSEIVRYAKRDKGKTHKELLEVLLNDEELGPDESIQPVVWRMLVPK